MDDFEYITEYKGYDVYQDMETGYFYVLDSNDNALIWEATQKLVRLEIDRLK